MTNHSMDFDRISNKKINVRIIRIRMRIMLTGTVTKRSHLYLKKAGLNRSVLPLRKACLLGTARIGDGHLKVMDTCY